MRRGRKPSGAELVESAEGSPEAKKRLRAIFEAMTGEKTVGEVSEELGIGEAMLHRLKSRVVQAGVDVLEPKRPGRKPKSQKAEEETPEEKLEAIEAEIRAARVRTEVAVLVPELGAASLKKKPDEN